MYKPVRLDARDRAVQLGVQGKAEQRLGGAEWRLGGSERRLGRSERRLGGSERRLGGSERRLGRVGEAAELCGVAELLGVQGKAEQRLGGAGGGALWSGRDFGCSPYSYICCKEAKCQASFDLHCFQ